MKSELIVLPPVPQPLRVLKASNCVLFYNYGVKTALHPPMFSCSRLFAESLPEAHSYSFRILSDLN